MKHKFLTVLLALVAAFCLCFGLVACGDTPAGGTQTEQGSTDGSEDDGGDKETEGDEDETPDGGKEEDEGGDKQPDEGGQGGSEGEGGNTPDVGGGQEPDEGDQGTGGDDEPCAHQYTAENVCSLCGDEWKYTEGLNYTYDEATDTYAVGRNTNVSGDVVIPYGYQGKFVTKIGEGVFRDCSGMISITIPGSVTEIGESAFTDCDGLSAVNITDLAAWCKITSFSFSYGVNNPLWYAHHLFLNGKEIKELEIPSDVSVIMPFAFVGASITSVKIPDSVTMIGGAAFWDCEELKNITIGTHVTSVGLVAFHNTAYYDDPKNWDETDALYLGNVLISVKPTVSGSFAVRTGTICIASGAFVEFSSPASAKSGCTNLAEVIIPDSVQTIGGLAFLQCTKLKTVIIPASVTQIEDQTFRDCKELTDIQFKGSVAEWQAIEKASEKASEWNSGTGDYTVTCTNGTVDKEGNVTYFGN